MKSNSAAVVTFIALLFAVACGGPASSAAVGSASKPVASPNALACRLPVAGFIEPTGKGTPDPAGENKGAGGFLDLRNGTYTPVASSDQSYVAAADVWLPVSPQSISPDGRTYVASRAATKPGQPASTTALYLVDVRSRTEHLMFTAPDGDFAFVLSYTSAGIYVETGGASGSSNARPLQLLVIDPATGLRRTVAGTKMPAGATYQAWINVSDGAGWAMLVRAEAKDAQAGPGVDLVRLSLADGTRSTWYSGSGAFVLIGFDWNGHPILQTSALGAATSTLVAVVGPQQTSIIEAGGGKFNVGRGSAVTDAHGMWVGSSDGGVWLYAPPGSFNKVGTVPPQTDGTGVANDPHAWRSIAGPCL